MASDRAATVYAALTPDGQRRTSPQNVEDVLAAIVAAGPTRLPEGWKLDRIEQEEPGIVHIGTSFTDSEDFAGVVTVDTAEYFAPQDAEPIARAIVAALAGDPPPIDMVLYCPRCGTQHIDGEEYVEVDRGLNSPPALHKTWDNPPHRSHECHNCAHVWRPADVPTNGVLAVKTSGKNDDPVVQPTATKQTFHDIAADALADHLRAGQDPTAENQQRAVESEGRLFNAIESTPPLRHSTDEDPIRSLIAKHAELAADDGDFPYYCYFELAYTRHTAWMAWLCSKPREDDPSRKIIASGQGQTPDDACREALAVLAKRAANGGGQ